MKIGKLNFPLASIACAAAALVAILGIFGSLVSVIINAIRDLDLLWSSLGAALVSGTGALIFAGILAYLAIMIFMDRKDWLTLIGFGLLLVLKIGDFCTGSFGTISGAISMFRWFEHTWYIIISNFINLGGICCVVLGHIVLGLMAAAILLKWKHKIVDTLKKLWYIPAAAVIVGLLVGLFATVIILVGNLIGGQSFGTMLLTLLQVCVDLVGQLITQVAPAFFLAHWLAGIKEQ